MGLSLCFLTLSVFSLLLFNVTVAHITSSTRPLCHDDERSALLQFKDSFITDGKHQFFSCRPKVASWKQEEGNIDCCSWDGVECSRETGHVIKLDLSSSCLYGSINSSNSLFSLVHLEWLSLAYNSFNDSEIPPEIVKLSRLTYLNFSESGFHGQIPSEILQLWNLVSLDLSGNSLKLNRKSLRNLVENLTNLLKLDLHGVRIASPIDMLANLSSLNFLSLSNCALGGAIPSSLGNLTNLVYLDLSMNELSGAIPSSLGNLTNLVYLDLSMCGLSGQSPNSIGNLGSLKEIDLLYNLISGKLPISTGNLSSLRKMDLSWNRWGELPSSIGNLGLLEELVLLESGFSGELPTSIGNLGFLKRIDISFCNFWGQVPTSLGNLSQLHYLDFSYNNFSGELPTSIGNLSSLEVLKISSCNFSGKIPFSLGNLNHLSLLDFSSNSFSGTVELDLFLLKLKNLDTLLFSSNNLSLLTKTSTNTTTKQFLFIGLRSCNLTQFPSFLRTQNHLQMLDLSSNKLPGLVPSWLLNSSAKSLEYLNLSHNLLTGFDQHPIVFPWTQLSTLDLSYNKLQGLLPAAPTSTLLYLVSNNMLTGEIPAWVCNLSNLTALDLSYNNLSGVLPQCLGSFSAGLTILKLRSNKFSGSIPPFFSEGNNLGMIDLSDNLLQGKIPRSFINCTMLEFLDLGNNQINDTFPSWLENLRELKVLILRSNRLHGVIEEPKTYCRFTKLRIIDLSNNIFGGRLPSKQFKCWIAMKFVDISHLEYMGNILDGDLRNRLLGFITSSIYSYSLTMSNKGQMMAYEKIPYFLTAVVFSSNRFDGDIPASIANLEGLKILSLADNNLKGQIPSCLANLTNLESLDLSNNNLSGQIPQQLVELTFLGFFDVSHNNLAGPIPQGNQFNTFDSNSFDGNSGLCGNPLPKKCGDYPETDENENIQNSKTSFAFHWEIILMGYASGLIVGVVLGLNYSTRISDWFAEKFGRQSKRSRRKKGRRNRM